LSWPEFCASWAARWDDVLAQADNTSPFLTLEWLAAWWSAFGEPGSEQILVVAHDDGPPEAFVFLRRSAERHAGIALRTLRSWVNSHGQRAVLVRIGDPRTVANALLAHWCRERRAWDVIRLDGCEVDSAVGPALVEVSTARGLPACIAREWEHSRIAIDRSWSEFYGGIPKKVRSKQERLGRRLAERGACTWLPAREPGEVADAFERYLELERRSWKQRGGETIADDATLAAFYREVVARMGERQRCQVDLLCFEGKPIAGIVSLLAGGRLLTLKTSYDMAFAHYSPGGWLGYQPLIEDAFERRLSLVDFYCSRPFSRRWTREVDRYCDVALFSPTLRGRAAARARAWKGWLRDRVRATRGLPAAEEAAS
jgi:CelD/BcsL family acetyltransferase involved in cellulose biosynthesis